MKYQTKCELYSTIYYSKRFLAVPEGYSIAIEIEENRQSKDKKFSLYFLGRLSEVKIPSISELLEEELFQLETVWEHKIPIELVSTIQAYGLKRISEYEDGSLRWFEVFDVPELM